jgi:hypothetical protein
MIKTGFTQDEIAKIGCVNFLRIFGEAVKKQAAEIFALEDKQSMQFILGVILFVVVIGALDAGLPWPRCGSGSAKQ